MEIEVAIEVEEENIRMTKMKGVGIEEEGEATMTGETERGEEGIVVDADVAIIITGQMTKRHLETIMLK